MDPLWSCGAGSPGEGGSEHRDAKVRGSMRKQQHVGSEVWRRSRGSYTGSAE